MIEKTLLLKILLTPAFMLGQIGERIIWGFIPRKLVDWASSYAEATEDRKAQLYLLKTPDMNVGVIDECCSIVINFNYVSKKFD